MEFVTKSEINKSLKDLKLGFVKYTVGQGEYQKESVYKDWSGSHKGIYVYSRGPMTVTSAWRDFADKMKREVMAMTYTLGGKFQDNGNSFIIRFQIADNKEQKMTFALNDFPTYAPNMNYDSGYRKLYWELTENKTQKIA